MAGMEKLEIHSKSYLIRWVEVQGGHSISWSIQPHKKSINFAIFKHPGAQNGLTPNLPQSSTFDSPDPSSTSAAGPGSRRISVSRKDSSNAVERLKAIGLVEKLWVGNLEAEKVSLGQYDVLPGDGGMFGLVFDNTFSKTVSKTATVVLLTYPTNSPPQSNHQLHHFQAVSASNISVGSKKSPALPPITSESTESFHPLTEKISATQDGRRPSHTTPSDLFTGILQKRRRKKHQGYARRFFSLDFSTSTLSYYYNRQSSALRGSIPLSLAAIAANDGTREISIDSGAEVWHLKANNEKDFEAWASALEKASQAAVEGTNGFHTPKLLVTTAQPSGVVNEDEDREWARIEVLVGRVAETRNSVRRLAQSTDPKYQSSAGLGISPPSNDSSPIETSNPDILRDGNPVRRKSFWKRSPSNGPSNPPALPRSVSTSLAIPPTPPLPSPRYSTMGPPEKVRKPQTPQAEEDDVHERSMATLHELDAIVSAFNALIAESKRRRMPVPGTADSRRSFDSTASQEFFDADAGPDQSGLLMMRRDSDEKEEDLSILDENDSGSSDVDGRESFTRKISTDQDRATVFPTKPKSLTPLPISPIERRTKVPPATVLPPSIISFLRKNVGKDLSTTPMPVSSNEPISALQRVAENLEYSSLLDAAVHADASSGERLLYVAAFAVSPFSNGRVKERSIRKPFNPMLGETFELVREDMGFRFVSEKVSHRPVRLASQADAKEWSFSQSPMPIQKFWGKSLELNTDGRARVTLHSTGDCYSWTQAPGFLRNIIAGEKYFEPVGSMTVLNETTGEKAVITFKSKGMFSGRSEDVVAQAFDAHGRELPLGLVGKWTTSLTLTSNGSETKTIWKTGELVPDAPKRYGFTTFAASLNEITSIEKARLPPTDSRLRPDQRAAEDGYLDLAEDVKHKLEEAQRDRRKQMEARGETWKPRWFEKVEGYSGADEQEVWKLKSGKGSYWERRAAGVWDAAPVIFEC